MQGHKIIDIRSEKSYKASDIHRSLSLNNLFKRGILPNSNEILHKTLEKPYQQGLKFLQSESKNIYNQKMR